MTEREIAHKKAAARKTRMERERKARNRRMLTTVALMLVVCIASIGGTIAWLTDKTEAVTNTFSPSNIDIWMTETVEGQTQTTQNDQVITNDTYKMVPGTELDKDPKVFVAAASEDCWVFIEVAESANLSNYISYNVNSGWTKLGTSGKKSYYYRECLNGARAEGYPVIGYTPVGGTFTDNKVFVNTSVTKEMMDALANGTSNPSLSFKAAAVQKANIAENAASITSAWNEVKGFFGYTGESNIAFESAQP